MSTIWTPRGEHRVPRAGEDEKAEQAAGAGAPAPSRAPGGGQALGLAGEQGAEPTPEEMADAQAQLEAMREQLLQAPVEAVIANHAMGIWELAALHLSARPPQLAKAQLAIDALSSLVDGVQGRLGEAEKTLRDGLAQIRMAFVEIHRAEQARSSAPSGGPEGQS